MGKYQINIYSGDMKIIGVKYTDNKDEVHDLCRLAPGGGGAWVYVGKTEVADYLKSGDSIYWYI